MYTGSLLIFTTLGSMGNCTEWISCTQIRLIAPKLGLRGADVIGSYKFYDEAD